MPRRHGFEGILPLFRGASPTKAGLPSPVRKGWNMLEPISLRGQHDIDKVQTFHHPDSLQGQGVFSSALA